jgi:hypothetical protein
MPVVARLVSLALFAAAVSPRGAAPVVSGVTTDATCDGFTVSWTTDQPSTSVVKNSAGVLLAADPALVTAHRVIYRCYATALCTLTCDDGGNCGVVCHGLAGDSCATPSQNIAVESANAAGETGRSDNRGGFYQTHQPVLGAWREVL